MITPGNKVYLIDDNWDGAVLRTFDQLPRTGIPYVVRDIVAGLNKDGTVGTCIRLIGLNNKKHQVRQDKPAIELAFDVRRFRKLIPRSERTGGPTK